MVARSARQLCRIHGVVGERCNTAKGHKHRTLPSTENQQHLIHHIQPTPQPPLSSSPPRNILFQVANDATSLHAIKQRRVQKRLVCDASWGKTSRVQNSVKSARAKLRPTEMNPLHPEIFRSNTRNACSKHQLSQPNSCYKWHDTNSRCLWCELSK
jgi:hypothetical protein